MKASLSQLIYESGQVQVDLARRELRVRGSPVPIGGRAFEIIEVLVRASGEVVTKDDLMRRVWPGAIVEENTIWVHISAVRKALGPDRGKLKTVSGRGYRLLGPWNIARATTSIGDTEASQGAQPSASTASNNLPAAGTNLIGRGAAEQEVQDLLTAYRLITLTGPGGIGKTRLALEAARHMLAQGQSDVWLAELASLSDPDLVPSSVASSLGLRVVDLSAEAVARAIGRRKILLLLDNCEHVIDAAATFAETMIRLCPDATILATSREVLRIDGEYVYRVPPLDVPDEQDTPANILKSSAVQLLVARTKAMHSAFMPDEPNLRAIAGICQRLDGIPLAIEFAAARAAMLGVSQVAADLDNRFSLLTAGRRTTLARHQTLRAALDWSYDLLTAAEQCLLSHVSIFPAGFTADAATAVMRNAGHQTAVVDDIGNLVAKSLVTLDGSAPGGRWRLLETIRAYAFEKLREEGEAERALRGHAEYFLDVLTPTNLVSIWEPAREEVVRHRRELNNIRAALDWCFSPGGDVSMGAAMASAFLPVWIHLALYAECRRRTEIALAHLSNKPDGNARLRMLLHIGRGFSLPHTGGRPDEAASALTEGLRIAKALGDTISQMYALWGLWIAHAFRGNYRAAAPLVEQFWRLTSESTDPARGFQANRLMGGTMSYRGNQPKAREHLDRAADLYRQSLARPARMAWFGRDLSNYAQSVLARVLVLQGFVDQARHVAQDCVDRAQRASQKMELVYGVDRGRLSHRNSDQRHGCGGKICDAVHRCRQRT